VSDDLLPRVAGELDVAATNVTGAVGRKLKALADEIWESIGGRPKPTTGDPNQPSPGPGVRAPVVVDSVGDIEDKVDDVDTTSTGKSWTPNGT